MEPRSVDAGPRARVAVVGASTASGTRLREALARRGVPGSRVDLFGSADGDAVLSEYDGEARLIRRADPDELAGHAVVFLCEVSAEASRIAALAAPARPVIDLTGRFAREADPHLVHVGIDPDSVRCPSGLLAMPHPLSAVLAEILHPIDREVGMRQAVVVIHRPAADFGDPGIDELREQTVRLLRFERVPHEVFGRQLAFNLIPQGLILAEGEKGLEGRISREVATLLGWETVRLTVRLLTAPVFHGHSLCLRLELSRTVGAPEVAAAVSLGRGTRLAAAGSSGTPLSAPEERRTEVFDVSEDGIGGFWIWAIAGEAGSAAAEQAVLAAERLVDL